MSTTGDFTAGLTAHAAAILAASLDCIVGMDAEGRVTEFNPAAERTFGYSRAEVIGRELAECIVPPDQREAHRKGLARYLATGEGPVIGRRVELEAMRADGSLFPVELAISRVALEGPPAFIAYLRDISARVQRERLRNARWAVTQHLSLEATAEEAALAAVRAVCENLQWEVGFFWSVDTQRNVLICAGVWQPPGQPLSQFVEASRARTFSRGEGLPGRTWESAAPQWISSVTDEANFPRAAAAAHASVRSAIACPVRVADRVLGVLEFFTQRTREPDEDLRETIATICAHLGQVIERSNAERALRESEARFRALMEQAPFSVQIFSPDGRTVRVNAAWRELWGVTLDQIGTYNVLEDAQLEAKGVLPHLRRAFAGEPALLPTIAYDPRVTLPDVITRDDAVRWVSAVAYPLKDATGRVTEVVLVHQDVTDRARAEEAMRASEERLRLLVDTIPQLAWMALPDGHIFWYNKRWYEYTGTTPQEMEGWGWQSVHDPNVLPEVIARWTASLTRGEPFDMVFPLRGADGEFRPFLTRVNPLRNAQGEIEYWFGTNTDVSDIKRMEESLREADRRKDEFLAILAHELRNPIAPIRTGLDLVKLRGANEPMPRNVLSIMERQVSHLMRLVDDLLELSRITRGTFELRKSVTPLSSIIDVALEISQAAIDEGRQALHVSVASEPLAVDGDAVRLAQVVANLLINAATYTPADGTIHLDVKRDGPNARISVTDTGEGIAAEDLPRLFQMFMRGQHTAQIHQRGLGIGLALVRSLVEMHGGTVRGQSAGRGKGSCFTVYLPLVDSPSAAETRADAAARSIQRRILVVDDNADAAQTLAILLRELGAEVEVAFDGPSALHIAEALRPDVVLLDIGMPGMDGYEVARRLRASPHGVACTLIAVTGWGQDEDRKRSDEAGFDSHLVKPASLDALQALINAPDGLGAR